MIAGRICAPTLRFRKPIKWGLMRKTKLTAERQQKFLNCLAESGNVSLSAKLAGTSRVRVYALRRSDPAFKQAWDEAEEIAADRLEEEARRRAVEGFDEPLVSGGKLVQDAAGHVVTVRRYSDALLLALLRAHRPERFGKRLSAEPGISGSAVSVDVRTMLLAKLAQLAGDAEAQPRPLPEDHAEPHAPAPAASSAEDA